MVLLGGLIGAALGLRAQVVGAYVVATVYVLVNGSTFLSQYFTDFLVTIFNTSEASVLSYYIVLLFLLIVSIAVGKRLFEVFGGDARLGR